MRITKREGVAGTGVVVCVCGVRGFSVLPAQRLLIAHSLSFEASSNLIVGNHLTSTHIHPSPGCSDSEMMSFLGAAFYINLF